MYVIPETIISAQITLARCIQGSIYKGCSLKGNLCCELARVRHRALQRKPMTRKRMTLVFVFLPLACHRLAETSANGLPAGVIHYSDVRSYSSEQSVEQRELSLVSNKPLSLVNESLRISLRNQRISFLPLE